MNAIFSTTDMKVYLLTPNDHWRTDKLNRITEDLFTYISQASWQEYNQNNGIFKISYYDNIYRAAKKERSIQGGLRECAHARPRPYPRSAPETEPAAHLNDHEFFYHVSIDKIFKTWYSFFILVP